MKPDPEFARDLTVAFDFFILESFTHAQRERAFATTVLQVATENNIDIELLIRRLYASWYGVPRQKRSIAHDNAD